jgi:hypothetical protein
MLYAFHYTAELAEEDIKFQLENMRQLLMHFTVDV